MDNKKKIILHEIEHWKKSKLLPEHYCDFLSTLYSEGDVSVQDKKQNGFSSKIKFLILLSNCALIVCSFLGFYFIDFSNQMQMYLITLFIFIIYLVGIRAYMKEVPYAHILFSISCFLVLIGVTRYLHLWVIEEGVTRALLLLFACIVWLITGTLFRIFYLQFLGFFAAIIILGWSTLPFFESDFSWLRIESIWVSAAAFVFLLSRATRYWNLRLSLTLFFNSVILLFVPIIQSMYIQVALLDIIQLVLFIKVILMSLMLFFSRDRLTDIIKMMS